MTNNIDSNEIYNDVTIEDIKKCEGFENISDELAQQIADAIRVHTEIIYRCYIDERFPEQQADDNSK
jgi:hypothetical protein